MSYSYFANEAPTRSLESILEDVAPCSTSNVYQNMTPNPGDRILHEASQSFNAHTNNFSALHSNPAIQTGIITGVVRLILPPHSFTQRNGKPGNVQSFIVVDTFAQRLNSDVWRYKIVAWNEQAKNLNIETNHMYRFDHFKMKPVKGNSKYPGQDDYEAHLTSISTITEVTV